MKDGSIYLYDDPPRMSAKSLLSRMRDEEMKRAVLGFSSLEEADVVLAAMGY